MLKQVMGDILLTADLPSDFKTFYNIKRGGFVISLFFIYVKELIAQCPNAVPATIANVMAIA